MRALTILFVATADSVHTARWISQLRGTGHRVVLFPALWPCPIHPLIEGLELAGLGLYRSPSVPPALKVIGAWPWRKGGWLAESVARRLNQCWLDRAWQLARVIERVKPDILHTLEVTRAGYVALDAEPLVRGPFPAWLYSAWGSDFTLFGRQPQHEARVRAVLQRCRYQAADCLRDLRLAGEFGYAGKVMGVFPGGGGFDVDRVQPWRRLPVAARKTVLLKGYHDDFVGGRALTAICALRACAAVLGGFEVAIYSAAPCVVEAADAARREVGLSIRIIPPSPHDAILREMGQARVAIGLGLSDGTPNAMLEAMLMGALPIQSDAGAVGEWVDDGHNGLLVGAEDVAAVERAIRRALTDDDLVNTAARANLELARQRLDAKVVRPRVLALYETIATDAGKT